MDDERKKREAEYHDRRFSGTDDLRDPTSKYYSIMQITYRAYEALILRYCRGKRILEYGCGDGSKTAIWDENGAIATGIDISSEGIRKAKEAAERDGTSIEYYVMDAENLEFENDSFDLVVGTGILHHLNLDKACSELTRVLRAGGHAVFIEPMGHNPFINLYRRMTPAFRSIDEHPLLMKDIRFFERYFGAVKPRHFHILTLLAIPFRNMKGFGGMLKVLGKLDAALMKLLPFMKRISWTVLLDLSDPVTNPNPTE
jgi:SAM-dependent methyltransferase